MSERRVVAPATLDVDQRLNVGGIVQELLVDLIDLALQAKQAHWNLRGPMFRDLHLLLDELVGAAHGYADLMAERCLAVGIAADGRAATVAAASHLDSFPEGRIGDRRVVELMVERLQMVSEVGRSRLRELGDLDLVSQDLVIGVLEGIEKHRWMFQAHNQAED